MIRRLSASILLTPSLLGGGAVGCAKEPPTPQVQPVPAPSPHASAEPRPAESASASVAALDAAPPDGPWIGAIVMQAPIWSEMDWPGDKRGEREAKSMRLGYLRYGEKAAVIPEPHRKPNCPEGWYELLAGGFVCGKYVTLDMEHPKVKGAKPPNLSAALPYTYGVNFWNGTPLYRSLPSREQRKRYEPWLFRPKKAKPESEELGVVDAGDPSSEDPDADVPWWEREVPDGGPPQVTLEDLQESGGPVTRRMVKGFILSLDHTIDAGGTKWWKTMAGLSTPADRIVVSKLLTEFHGVWLGKDEATYATKNAPARRIDKLPVAFVLSSYAKRWALDEGRKHASVAEGSLDRFDAVSLTGEQARVAGTEFWETDEGFWLRTIDATKTEPKPPPEHLGEQEKWIDVNLRRQTLVAFEGTTPVFATLISSGRNEHETPPGTFRIREKHIAATMDGDSDTATDGPYSIEDVPYIEYFNAGYAFHGAFWHGQFGSVKSHGCVNLAPWDARALFGWSDPQLPDGWHAVYATKEKPGTRVIVHEKGPGTCEGPKAEPPQCPEHS